MRFTWTEMHTGIRPGERWKQALQPGQHPLRGGDLPAVRALEPLA